MKNEDVIQKIQSLGWDESDDILLTIDIGDWNLCETNTITGEWRGNHFETKSDVNWRWGRVEGKTNGSDLIYTLSKNDLESLTGEILSNPYITDADDGNVECEETVWENPLTDEEFEELSDSDETVFSLGDVHDGDVWWNGGVERLVIRVGDEEIEIVK